MTNSRIKHSWLLIFLLAGCTFSKPLKRYEIKFEIMPGTSEQDIRSAFTVLQNRLKFYLDNDNDLSMVHQKNYIIISIATTDSISHVVNILSAPGKLQFLETYSAPEFYSYLTAIDSAINNQQEARDKNKTPPSTLEGAVQAHSRHPLFSVLNILTNNDKISGKPTIVNGPGMGYVFSKDTSQLMKYLNDASVKPKLPANVQFMFSSKPVNNDAYTLYAVHPPELTRLTNSFDANSNIKKIYWSLSGNGHSAEIHMEMNEYGVAFWEYLTRQNVNKSIAIVLDGKVYVAPNVANRIPDGRISITGNFTPEEAKDLVYIIKGGTLDHFPLKLVNVK